MCSGDPDTRGDKKRESGKQRDGERDACGTERAVEEEKRERDKESGEQINHRGRSEHEIEARPEPRGEDVERKAGGVRNTEDETDVLEFGGIAWGGTPRGADVERGAVEDECKERDEEIPSGCGAGWGM